MDLKKIMKEKNFVVLGDTINKEKYAYRIKQGLLKNNYNCYAVGKELKSINDIKGPTDIIDLCIHPVKGIKLLKENKKDFKCIVIQPGAGSPEIIDYLESENLPYIEGCLLVGLSLYSDNEYLKN